MQNNQKLKWTDADMEEAFDAGQIQEYDRLKELYPAVKFNEWLISYEDENKNNVNWPAISKIRDAFKDAHLDNNFSREDVWFAAIDWAKTNIINWPHGDDEKPLYTYFQGITDLLEAQKMKLENQNTLLAVEAIAYTLNKIGYQGSLSANNFFQLYLRDETLKL